MPSRATLATAASSVLTFASLLHRLRAGSGILGTQLPCREDAGENSASSRPAGKLTIKAEGQLQQSDRLRVLQQIRATTSHDQDHLQRAANLGVEWRSKAQYGLA